MQLNCVNVITKQTNVWRTNKLSVTEDIKETKGRGEKETNKKV